MHFCPQEALWLLSAVTVLVPWAAATIHLWTRRTKP